MNKFMEHRNFQFCWHQQNIYQYHKSNLEISSENDPILTTLLKLLNVAKYR